MAEPGTKSRVIPIKLAAAGTAASADDVHARLVREGWMRQMMIGEPRLSELVATYEKLGYEVRVEPYQASADDGDAESDSGQETGQPFGTVYVRKPQAAFKPPG